jgi:3-oxoacyl-[acyl-carrier-protein] synthase-3
LFDGLAAGGFEIPDDRWFTNLPSKGNTGAASIYIILEELMASGRVEPGQRILCFVPESSRFSFAVFQLTAV